MSTLEYYETISKMTPAQLADLWQEETEQEFGEMLDVLPPARMKDNAFMVGECVTHSAAGPIHDAHVRVNGRYFWRPAPLRQFSPALYTAEIRARYFDNSPI